MGEDILRAHIVEFDRVLEQVALLAVDGSALPHLFNEHEKLLLRHLAVGLKVQNL